MAQGNLIVAWSQDDLGMTAGDRGWATAHRGSGAYPQQPIYNKYIGSVEDTFYPHILYTHFKKKPFQEKPCMITKLFLVQSVAFQSTVFQFLQLPPAVAISYRINHPTTTTTTPQPHPNHTQAFPEMHFPQRMGICTV